MAFVASCDTHLLLLSLGLYLRMDMYGCYDRCQPESLNGGQNPGLLGHNSRKCCKKFGVGLCKRTLVHTGWSAGNALDLHTGGPVIESQPDTIYPDLGFSFFSHNGLQKLKKE